MRCLRLAILACAAIIVCPEAGTPQSADRARAERLMAVLVAAYPDFLSRYDGNEIVWKDGTRMAFDDGRGAKDFETLLAAPDLEDMFYVSYPLGRSSTPPAFNSDPGRVRYQPLFAKMYGDCSRGEVARHLADVVWLPSKVGQKLKATRINDVAERLQAVSDELEKLPADMTKYLDTLGRHLQLPSGRRHRSHLGARARHCHRYCDDACRLLVLEPPRPRRPLYV